MKRHTKLLRDLLKEHMRQLAKKGGAKGGKARAAKLTPEERRESARKAARARWAGERRKRRA